MCIICVELEKNTLLPWEATRNFSEISGSIPKEHHEEVKIKINEAFQYEAAMELLKSETIRKKIEKAPSLS